MGVSGRVAIAPEPLRVTRERSGSGARRPSMHATRKLPLDPELVEKKESQQWSDKTQAEVYGDYYADRKWSRQWLLPGFGKGNSTRIDKWARKYLVKEYQRMAGGKKKEPVWMAGEVKVLKVFVGSTLVYTVFAIVQVICDRGLAAHDSTTWPLASEIVDILFTCIFLVEILQALVGGFFFLISPVNFIDSAVSSWPASSTASSCSRSRRVRRAGAERGGAARRRTTLIQLMRLFKMARIITTPAARTRTKSAG